MKKILILTASPDDQQSLHLNTELREIQKNLRCSQRHDQFEIVIRLAINPSDCLEALLDEKPHIVHFSGHASEYGLYVEDKDRRTKLVKTETLAKLFEQFKDKIECVLLNACDTQSLAKQISQYIKYVIGMKEEISDEAAIKFSAGFYGALMAGCSYQDSYKFGCLSIELEGFDEYSTPELLTKKVRVTLPSAPGPEHYKDVVDAIALGQLVPFLGAGVNVDAGQTGIEINLAKYLAKKLGYSSLDIGPFSENKLVGVPCPRCYAIELPEECPVKKALDAGIEDGVNCPIININKLQELAVASMELRCLAQYFSLKFSYSKLYRELKQYFKDLEYKPNPLHKFLAQLPDIMRDKKYKKNIPCPLIVTTTFDDSLERAFKAEEEKYDLVFYVTQTEDKGHGRFMYQADGKDAVLITDANVTELPIGERTVILKLYGSFNHGHCVITEDDYIKYLVEDAIVKLLPPSLLDLLEESNILFMGYRLNDLNLHFILNRLWKGQDDLGESISWVIHQSNPGLLEQGIWENRRVKLICSGMEDYVSRLQGFVEELQPNN